MDNRGHTHHSFTISRCFTLLLALSISELPLLCQREVLLNQNCSLWTTVLSIRPVFSWYACLLLHATITVHMRCVGRGVTLCCSIVKVKHGINAVQSKLQGRHNVTVQQLFSFFLRSTVLQKLLINIDSCQKVCAIC